ncbi:MAG: hypothetical protein RL213_2015 [Bacteroidota bacterium]|jgi:ankyrin repeat protein
MKTKIVASLCFAWLINGALFANSTGLATAITSGDIPAVEAQLQLGTDVNAIAENGFTPLAIACQNGNEKIAAMLIASGADVNLPSQNSATPLIEAARSGNPALTDLLLAEGADVGYMDMNRMNAYDHVVEAMPPGPATDSGYGRVFTRLQEEIRKKLDSKR